MSDHITPRPRRSRGRPNYDNRTVADGDREPTTDALGRTWRSVQDTDLPADIILPRLLRVRQTGPHSWTACCPVHGDANPSLSVTELPDFTLLVHCFSGIHCNADTITAALGLDTSFLFASGYAARHAKKTGRSDVAPTTGPRPTAPGEIDTDPKMKRLARHYRTDPDAGQKVCELADALGVDEGTLLALSVGWDPAKERWSFPERDHNWRVVGILYRHRNGRKICERDGHRGLYLPRGADKRQDALYLTEGASDAAALMSAGVAAIGRPAGLIPAHARYWLARWLETYAYGREVTVVGDRDDTGRVGASDLAVYLTDRCVRPVRWAMPSKGHKDVRELVLAGKWPHGLKIQTSTRGTTK